MPDEELRPEPAPVAESRRQAKGVRETLRRAIFGQEALAAPLDHRE